MKHTELTPDPVSDRLALAYRLHRLRMLRRDAAILELVDAGEPLQRVADAFGLSRERVRQIARDEAIAQGVQRASWCRGCGARIAHPNRYCSRCQYCSCGTKLARPGVGAMCDKCRPKRPRKHNGRPSMRRVERGISRVYYPMTGKEGPGFYVAVPKSARSPGTPTTIRCDTLEEARNVRIAVGCTVESLPTDEPGRTRPELAQARALSALPSYIRAQLGERGWAYVSALDSDD